MAEQSDGVDFALAAFPDSLLGRVFPLGGLAG